MIKKTIKVIGALLLVLIIAAIAIPYFFKDQIVQAVKNDINKGVNAKVDFNDVSLSLFKSFPDLYFRIDQLSITGINEFEGYKLMDAERIKMSLDIMSVISADRPLEIHRISIQKPTINILILRDGKANYDIMKTSDAAVEESTAEDSNFLLQLQSYAIEDAAFVYDDRSGGTYVEVEHLNHYGKGDFTQDLFDLGTTTSIGSLTAKSGGVTYLSKAKGAVELTLIADIANSRFTIKENAISLNALKLNMEGFVEMTGDKIKMDIKFDAPENTFKNFLSMIPSAYTADFNNVQANGNLAFDGFVKGSYEEKTGEIPAFLINLRIDHGDFKYPDLPLGMKGINITASINSPSSDLNEMVIDISNFSMELGNNPFEAKMKLWALQSDPHIDAKIKGTIDLMELSKAFPMDGVSTLNGIITANLTAKTSMSAIDAQDYENIDMAGALKVENLDYQADETPQIKVEIMESSFSPKYVKLDRFDAQLGKSDISAEGTIDNFLAYFSPEKTMIGKMKIRSNYFDANEWMSAEDSTQPSVADTTSNTEEDVFDRFDFTVDAEISKMHYDIYDLTDAKLVGQVTPDKVTIDRFQTKIGESDFSLDGTVTNMFNYIYENETLKGVLNWTSNYINTNEILLLQGEDAEEEMSVYPVPEKVDLTLNMAIGEVLYTNIPLRDIKGKIEVADEVAMIRDGSANALGGHIVMNGTYNTQNIEEPKFDMDYKLSSLTYREAFDKLNTFQALAPIGKFIEGRFNTTFKISGNLGKDMLPVLKTLSLDGFIETIEGTLTNFIPLEGFANKLNLNFLKSFDLRNTKNWFEVNNGNVIIKDFDVKTNGIDMVIGGTHGLDTDMAYHIKAKIPRKLLEKNAVGQAADKGLNFLQDQASKLGIDINQGEFVNIEALISGAMTKPNIKINLLDANGKATSIGGIADDIKDKVINKASDVIEDKTGIDVKNIEGEIDDIKEDLSAKADAEIAALMQETKTNIDKITSEAERLAAQTKLEAKKLSDITREEGYKQADELIVKAGEDLFKKKAAELAASKLRKTTDEKAQQIITKGDDTAKSIMDNAKIQTDKLQAIAETQAEEIRKKYE